ncbi:MAG: hypothetical protein ACYDBQ_10135 [Thermoplasmatota archaeon]
MTGWMRAAGILMIWVAAAGCATPQVVPPDTSDLRFHDVGTDQDPNHPEYREMSSGWNGPVMTPPSLSVTILDTAAAWGAAWHRHHAQAPFPIPFDSRLGAVAELNGTPSAGWTVEFVNASFQGGLYVLHVNTTEPGAGCSFAPGAGQAFDYATFDRELAHADQTKLEFVPVHRIVDC